jgi:hypothetical protein
MILFDEGWPEWDQVNTYIVVQPKFMGLRDPGEILPAPAVREDG